MIKAGYGASTKNKNKTKQKRFPHHPLTKFKMQKYYQNNPRFNGFNSKDICNKS